MKFPGYDQLYMLTDPVSSRPFRGNFEQADPGLPLSRAQMQPKRAITVSWAMGSGKPSDVIWTTFGCPLIVSARVVGLLSSEGFTGWSTYPVSVRTQSGEEREGYFGLAISGRFGEVDLDRSSIDIEHLPGGFWPRFRGYYFDSGSWSGDDLCIGEETCFRIVTERVAHALKKARVSNILLERLTQVSMMTSIYEIGKEKLLPKNFKIRVQAAYAKRDLQPPPEYQ